MSLNDIFLSFSDSIVSLVEKKIVSEETQQMIGATVLDVITSMVNDPNNQKNISEWLSGSVNAILEPLMEQIPAAMGLSNIDPPEESTEKPNTAMTVAKDIASYVRDSFIDDNIPWIVRKGLDRWNPNWKEDFEKRPEDAIEVMNLLKQFGVLDMLGNLGGSLTGQSPQTAAPRRSSIF